MTLATRLRWLEGRALPSEGVEVSELAAWARTLELDDLRCLVALGERDGEQMLPAGMTLEDARARARVLTAAAPESTRLLIGSLQHREGGTEPDDRLTIGPRG